MLLRLFSVNDSVLSPQPGKSIRIEAIPSAANSAATRGKLPPSSLEPPWPCAITTKGTAAPLTDAGETIVAGTDTPRDTKVVSTELIAADPESGLGISDSSAGDLSALHADNRKSPHSSGSRV